MVGQRGGVQTPSRPHLNVYMLEQKSPNFFLFWCNSLVGARLGQEYTICPVNTSAQCTIAPAVAKGPENQICDQKVAGSKTWDMAGKIWVEEVMEKCSALP